jgi:hypothetical protein
LSRGERRRESRREIQGRSIKE